MSSVDLEVKRLWEQIAEWLRGHGQERSLMSAVGTARIALVEHEMGTLLPPDLVALWRLEGVDAGYWLPPEGGCALKEPEEALRTRSILLEVAEEEDPADPMWSDRFGPELLPIAMNGGGDSLVIDLRTGEHRGAVFFWDHETWGLKVPLWPSVTTMLADTADALWAEAPALSWHAAQGGDESPCAPTINEWNEFDGWDVAP